METTPAPSWIQGQDKEGVVHLRIFVSLRLTIWTRGKKTVVDSVTFISGNPPFSVLKKQTIKIAQRNFNTDELYL